MVRLSFCFDTNPSVVILRLWATINYCSGPISEQTASQNEPGRNRGRFLSNERRLPQGEPDKAPQGDSEVIYK